MRLLAVVALIVVALGGATAARAQDFVGARALALGESYRAIATGNDAIYYNPAGLPLLRRYALEGHYVMDLVDERHQGDVSVVDSKTSPLAVGLAYTFQGSELTRRTTLAHTATLAVAYPIFPQLFALGAGFKYKNVSDAIAGNYLNAISADIGLLTKIPGGLSFGAVGYNLVPLRSVDSAHIPLSAGFAGAIDLGPLSALIFGGRPTVGALMDAGGVPNTQPMGVLRGPLDGLTLSCDWLVNFETLYGSKSQVSGGLEWILGESVPVRAGWWWDEVTDEHRASVGLGVVVPYFAVDVSLQQSVAVQPGFALLDRRVLSFALKGFLPM
ncbi:MAG: hypothetical protein FJ137_18130 [Deltaproteobacteria bacterium]|nr:hypothetical protein [Deltaproteobacteria bacterium]